MKIGDFDINVTTVRIGGGWQAEGILPDGKKIISGPKSTQEDAEHDVEQQAKARLYPQRRYDVNRPFESLHEDDEDFDASDLKDVTLPATITFVRDVEAMVQGGPFSFGAAENEFFEKGQQLVVKSVETMPPPDTDMSKIVLEDGRILIISTEDFQLTESMNIDERKAKLGSGERFAKLERSLSHQKGIRDPGAVAAAHGRKTLGKKRFQKLAAAGRRRHSESVEQKYPDLSPADEAIVMHQADRLLEAITLPDVHEINPETGEPVRRPECPNCGTPGEEMGQGRYYCPGCETRFSADVSRYGAGGRGAYGTRPKAAFYPSDGGSAGGGGGTTSV